MRCHKQPQSIAKYLCHNLGVPAGTKPSRLPPPMVRRDVIAHLAKLELFPESKGFWHRTSSNLVPSIVAVLPHKCKLSPQILQSSLQPSWSLPCPKTYASQRCGNPRGHCVSSFRRQSS